MLPSSHTLLALSSCPCSSSNKTFRRFCLKLDPLQCHGPLQLEGQLDVELNDVGRQQAVAVADRLSREPKISAVYSSDLKREFDTAKIIAESCGMLEVTKDPDLHGRQLGDLPEAKILESKNKRCTLALQRIAKKHRGERVVVTHGGAIRALFRGPCPHRRSSQKVLSTCFNLFHISDEEWSIRSWGDVSHLKKTGFLKA